MRKPIRHVLIIILLLFCQAVLAFGGPPSSLLRDGDIVFQTSRSSQSFAIQRATGSRYSHMGIVLFRNGSPFVFEAVATVRYTPLDQWIARGEGGHYVVMRLSDARLMTEDALEALRQQARAFEGKPYDLTFEWSDERIYCSELVWKMYERGLGIRIGEPGRLRDFRLEDPAVKKKMRERYGTRVPLNEPVISPGSMFNEISLTRIMDH